MNTIATQNKNTSLRDDLLHLKWRSNRASILKSLLFVAALAAGVAAIILLSSNFLAYGIATVVVSSFAIYKCVKHYQRTNHILKRAVTAVAQHADK